MQVDERSLAGIYCEDQREWIQFQDDGECQQVPECFDGVRRRKGGSIPDQRPVREEGLCQRRQHTLCPRKSCKILFSK